MASAEADRSEATGQWVVDLILTPDGATRVEALAGDVGIGRQIAIVIDDVLLSAPMLETTEFSALGSRSPATSAKTRPASWPTGSPRPSPLDSLAGVPRRERRNMVSDPTEPGAPGAGGAPPPPQYGAPQYGAPPPYQQQPYPAPARNPAQTLEMVANVVIIAGCVAAGCGLIAGFLAFATDDYSTTLKFQEFFLDLALGLGLGAIAVASGFFLRTQARRPGP